ncbi:hypothetical protein FO519_003667 [Halicephalobus sp. NKZ332]|nr:hypothetical protein FO519_003667 [Halicephalobus sp. NKZ332]
MPSDDTLLSLIGQATIMRGRGQIREATELLLEVVRQAPKMAEPYINLSEIYEDNDPMKALEYRLLYCYVSRKTSAFDWEDAGDRAFKMKKFEEASDCYLKAYSSDKTNWTYYQKRIDVLEELGLRGQAMKTRLQAALSIDINTCEIGFEGLQDMIMEVAEYYASQNDENKLIPVLKAYVKRSREFNVDFSMQLNTLLDTLKKNESHSEVVEVILSLHDGIKGYNEFGEEAYTITEDCGIDPFPPVKVADFVIEDRFPTHLICDLMYALLRLKFLNLALLLVDKLLSRRIDEFHLELYVDIVRAYADSEDLEIGMNFAKKLLRYPFFEMNPDVIFLCGLMEERLGEMDEALEFYKDTLLVQNDHVDARVNISYILQNRGDTEGALKILSNFNLDNCRRLPDERLLIHQLKLLDSPKENDQYIRCLRMLLVPHFYQVLQEEQTILSFRKRANDQKMGTVLRRVALKITNNTPLEKLVRRMGEISVKDGRDLSFLTKEQLFSYTIALLHALEDSGRYLELLHVTCFAAVHPEIGSVDGNTLAAGLFYAASRCGEYHFCLEYLRVKVHDALDVDDEFNMLSRLYVMMNYYLCHFHGEQYVKFLTRLLDKMPEDPILLMLGGNHAMMSGSYKHALCRYSVLNSCVPNNSLITFMSALGLIAMASRRDITSRAPIANRCLAFVGKYKNLRSKEAPIQEIYYNVGRFFHGLCIVNQAVYWYEKVLETPDFLLYDNDQGDGCSKLISSAKYDLKCLAALNIIHIIKHKNPAKARILRRKYCVL